MINMDGLSRLHEDLNDKCKNASKRPDDNTVNSAMSILPTIYIMTMGDGLTIKVDDGIVYYSIVSNEDNIGGVFRLECNGKNFKTVSITSVNGEEDQSEVNETSNPNMVSTRLMEFQSKIGDLKRTTGRLI